MDGRFGIEGEYLRNLLLVASIVGVVTMVVTEGTLLVRFVVGVVGGLISGVTFTVVTALINHFKPDHW